MSKLRSHLAVANPLLAPRIAWICWFGADGRVHGLTVLLTTLVRRPRLLQAELDRIRDSDPGSKPSLRTHQARRGLDRSDSPMVKV